MPKKVGSQLHMVTQNVTKAGSRLHKSVTKAGSRLRMVTQIPNQGRFPVTLGYTKRKQRRFPITVCYTKI